MAVSAPVALLVFNRPDLTRRVLAAVRRAAPSKVLIVADGPRDETERSLCDEARTAVLDGIDWSCEIKTNFADANLGCRARVSSGLDWVFSQVDHTIVLEDDCVPIDSFFSYCDTLLARYDDDERVMHIGGVNLSPGRWRSGSVLSVLVAPSRVGVGNLEPRVAPLRRGHDGVGRLRARGLLRSVATSRSEEAYYRVAYDRVRSGETDTWDYQWQFACWAQSGLAVVPRTSLVENVGFRADATHTTLDPTRGVATADIGELVHPTWVVRDRAADAAAFREIFAAGTLKQRIFNRAWLALWTVIPHSWRR